MKKIIMIVIMILFTFELTCAEVDVFFTIDDIVIPQSAKDYLRDNQVSWVEINNRAGRRCIDATIPSVQVGRTVYNWLSSNGYNPLIIRITNIDATDSDGDTPGIPEVTYNAARKQAYLDCMPDVCTSWNTDSQHTCNTWSRPAVRVPIHKFYGWTERNMN